MRKLSVLIGTAVLGAIVLVAILTTATFAQGTGPANMGPGAKAKPILQAALPGEPSERGSVIS